eukprot:217741-Hanusia_phi.AAC.3
MSSVCKCRGRTVGTLTAAVVLLIHPWRARETSIFPSAVAGKAGTVGSRSRSWGARATEGDGAVGADGGSRSIGVGARGTEGTRSKLVPVVQQRTRRTHAVGIRKCKEARSTANTAILRNASISRRTCTIEVGAVGAERHVRRTKDARAIDHVVASITVTGSVRGVGLRVGRARTTTQVAEAAGRGIGEDRSGGRGEQARAHRPKRQQQHYRPKVISDPSHKPASATGLKT